MYINALTCRIRGAAILGPVDITADPGIMTARLMNVADTRKGRPGWNGFVPEAKGSNYRTFPA